MLYKNNYFDRDCLTMKNNLKILLCTVFCAVLFSNDGYSMIRNNNINLQQNGIINKISIDHINDISACEILKLQVKDLKIGDCVLPELNSIYNTFKSIKSIINDNPERNILHDYNNKQKYINVVYNNFANKQYNEKHIKQLVNELLQDSIKFSIQYSPDCPGMDEQNSSYQLFGIAWHILYKYSANHKFKALQQKIDLLYNNFLPNINIYRIDNNIINNIVINEQDKIKLEQDEYNNIIQILLKYSCINTILRGSINGEYSIYNNITFKNYAIANYLEFYKNNKMPIETLLDKLYKKTINCYNQYKDNNNWNKVSEILRLAWITLIQYIRDKQETIDSYDETIMDLETKLRNMKIWVQYNDNILDFVTVDTDTNIIKNYIIYLRELSNKKHQRIMMTPYLYNKYPGLSHIIHSVTNNEQTDDNYSYLDGFHVITKKELFYYEHTNTYAHQFIRDLTDFEQMVTICHYNKDNFIYIANNLLRDTLLSITENSYRKDWVFTAAWHILIQYLAQHSSYKNLHSQVKQQYNLLKLSNVLDIEKESELINKYDFDNIENELMRMIMFSPNKTIKQQAKVMYNTGQNSIQTITEEQCWNQYKSLQNIIVKNILKSNLSYYKKLLCNARIFESEINNKINKDYTNKYESNIEDYDYGQHEDNIIRYLQMSKIQLLANALLKDNLLFLNKYNISKNSKSYELFNIAWNTLLEYTRVFRYDVYKELLKLIQDLQNSLKIKIDFQKFEEFYCENEINNIFSKDINNIDDKINESEELARKLRKNRKEIETNIKKLNYTEDYIESNIKTISPKIMFNRFGSLKDILDNIPRFNNRGKYYNNLVSMSKYFEERMNYFCGHDTDKRRDCIMWYTNELLKDNLSFIAKYSTQSNMKSSYYLFTIAWNILFQYIVTYKIDIKNLNDIQDVFAIPEILI